MHLFALRHKQLVGFHQCLDLPIKRTGLFFKLLQVLALPELSYHSQLREVRFSHRCFRIRRDEDLRVSLSSRLPSVHRQANRREMHRAIFNFAAE